ncbi:hypothetical protein B0H14DRAFT_2728481 [Mycena olivaceomarginata]|nr:hypothetical protein B0H14DRAFT_2728481 [Mycena olivaceomarginata]
MSHSPPSTVPPPQPEWLEKILEDPMALEAVWGQGKTQKDHWYVLCKCDARHRQIKGECSWSKHIKTDQHKGKAAPKQPRRPLLVRFKTHPYSQAALLHQLGASGTDATGRISGTPAWSSLSWGLFDLSHLFTGTRFRPDSGSPFGRPIHKNEQSLTDPVTGRRGISSVAVRFDRQGLRLCVGTF